jgi:hypothetical protein
VRARQKDERGGGGHKKRCSPGSKDYSSQP